MNAPTDTDPTPRSATAPRGDSRDTTDGGAPESPADDTAGSPDVPPNSAGGTRPVEIGGQKGPEPTRYGDWEKKGRCTDF